MYSILAVIVLGVGAVFYFIRIGKKLQKSSGLQSALSSLNLAAPTRPLEPKLFFKDTGNHCLLDKELDDLSSYIIGVRKYQDTTEAIINSVNNP